MKSTLIPLYDFLKNKNILSYPIVDEEKDLFDSYIDEYEHALETAKYDDEYEEHFKNQFNDLLKKVYSYSVNTSKRIDSVIKDQYGNIRVIIEVKRPLNDHEMVQEDDFNRKSFHEALLYYYEQREQNVSTINYIIITNCEKAYLFSSKEFEKLIKNKKIHTLLSGYKNKTLEIINTTSDFYHEATKILINEDISIESTKVDILHGDRDLIYRVFSPYSFFNNPLKNDANKLNRNFYQELLYIIGLEENKQGLIKSNVSNSFLDLTEEMIVNISAGRDISSNHDTFEKAFSLNIMWLNRILFLKILESQLRIFRNNKEFSILDPDKITQYTQLSKLFFNILSTPCKDRHEDDKERYYDIPYLNSSLFEETYLEKDFGIKNLDTERLIKIKSNSILYNNVNFKKKELTLLEYFFRFLNCYLFNSDEINQDPNTVIKSSVLGLVFEQLNGYKDGSHFTPANITMYMSKYAIQKKVIDRFNKEFSLKCSTYQDLVNYAKLNFYKEEIKENANKVVDSITILDPAVGSGHFLVSCMNELIKIKSDLSLLHDGIKIEIVNDELIVRSDFGYYFLYQKDKNGINIRKNEIQKSLFETKRKIIENQIFGVDINPNSINICHLRLWIELLKHTYFTDDQCINLELLPNLEFKVLTANSLIPLKEDTLFFHEEHKNFLYNKMKEYYYSCGSDKKRIKNELLEIIEEIKEKRGNEQLEGYDLFDIRKINNFFDSRLMFGVDNFDLIIMNPPYISLSKCKDNKNLKPFETYTANGDIYQIFMERAFDLINDKGIVCAITSNKWMRAAYGKTTRDFLYQKAFIHEILDLGSGLFDNATVDTNIITYEKLNNRSKQESCIAYEFNKTSDSISEKKLLSEEKQYFNGIILNNHEKLILQKINSIGKPLKDWDVSINYGIKTGLNEAFIIDTETKNKLISEDPKSDEILKPTLRGKDVKRYQAEFAEKWLILAKNGSNQYIEKKYPAVYQHLLQYKDKLKKRGQCSYSRNGLLEGQHHWLELDNNPKDNYLQKFEKPKIIYSEIVQSPYFIYDTKGFYANNTSYIMTGSNLLYLLAFFNSKIGYYAFKKFFAVSLGENGIRYKKIDFEKLPIPVPTHSQEKEISELVTSILSKKENGIDSSFEDNKIDDIFLSMVGLDQDERSILDIIQSEEYEMLEVEEEVVSTPQHCIEDR